MSETSKPALDEQWKPVVGFEALYEVSCLGRVRRIGRAARTGMGHGGGAVIGRVKKPQPLKEGYQQVLLWKNGRPFGFLVHNLVAAVFIGACPEGKEVNHDDGVKAHNFTGNLEYMTRSENVIHAYKNGLYPSGEKHRWAKLTENQVLEIKRIHNSGEMGFRRIAKHFGVSKSCIANIIRERTWKYGQK